MLNMEVMENGIMPSLSWIVMIIPSALNFVLLILKIILIIYAIKWLKSKT